MRKKINKAIALLAVLGILAGSGNVVYGNEENIADQEEQLTKEKESIYIDNTNPKSMPPMPKTVRAALSPILTVLLSKW